MGHGSGHESPLSTESTSCCKRILPVRQVVALQADCNRRQVTRRWHGRRRSHPESNVFLILAGLLVSTEPMSDRAKHQPSNSSSSKEVRNP